MAHEAALCRQFGIGTRNAPVTSGLFHPQPDNLPTGILDDIGSDLHVLLAFLVVVHLRRVGGEIVDALHHDFVPVKMWRDTGMFPIVNPGVTPLNYRKTVGTLEQLPVAFQVQLCREAELFRPRRMARSADTRMRLSNRKHTDDGRQHAADTIDVPMSNTMNVYVIDMEHVDMNFTIDVQLTRG